MRAVHQRAPAEDAHQQADRRHHPKEDDPHEDRASSPSRSAWASAIQARCTGPSMRGHEQAPPERAKRRAQDRNRAGRLSAPPEIEQAGEHQERNTDRHAELAPLGGGQSSWNSCFQSWPPSMRAAPPCASRNGPSTRAVDVGAHEAAIRVRRRADDRLATHVERGVHHDRTAGQPLELVDQVVVVGIVVPARRSGRAPSSRCG